jgi:hypothetical protein
MKRMRFLLLLRGPHFHRRAAYGLDYIRRSGREEGALRSATKQRSKRARKGGLHRTSSGPIGERTGDGRTTRRRGIRYLTVLPALRAVTSVSNRGRKTTRGPLVTSLAFCADSG